MKKRLLSLQLLLFVSISVAFAQFPDPFLTDDSRPDGSKWIPDPPSLTGTEFVNDFYFYQWGKTQRDGETGEQALSDESTPLYQVFSEAMGIKLSYTETPEIILLAEAATSDAHRSNKTIKTYYPRRRPFATFNEQSLNPEEDEAEATTLCYPSTHATNGWMFAFVLCSIAPEQTEAIMSRARDYAMNRVICGHHWKSDIDASLMLAAGLFPAIVTTEAYQQQLARAKKEYALAKGEVNKVSEQALTPSDSPSPTYNLQGQRVNAQDKPRQIYVRKGAKFIAK